MGKASEKRLRAKMRKADARKKSALLVKNIVETVMSGAPLLTEIDAFEIRQSFESDEECEEYATMLSALKSLCDCIEEARVKYFEVLISLTFLGGLFARAKEYRHFQNFLNELCLKRDGNLPGTIASNYKKGLIIREKGISDASVRVGGISTSHRYMILSNHMRNLRLIEHGTNWGLCVAPANAHFKVLDIYNYGNKTQILLLHLPEDGDWKLFQNAVFSLEGDLIKTARERFENNCNEAPIPELATGKWLARCAYPLGMDENGNFFELE